MITSVTAARIKLHKVDQDKDAVRCPAFHSIQVLTCSHADIETCDGGLFIFILTGTVVFERRYCRFDRQD